MGNLNLNKNVVMVCLTVIILAALGAYVWVEVRGGNTTRLLEYIGISVAPVIAGLAAYIRSDQAFRNTAAVQEHVTEIHDSVNTVKDQTNGMNDRLHVMESQMGIEDADQHHH